MKTHPTTHDTAARGTRDRRTARWAKGAKGLRRTARTGLGALAIAVGLAIPAGAVHAETGTSSTSGGPASGAEVCFDRQDPMFHGWLATEYWTPQPTVIETPHEGGQVWVQAWNGSQVINYGPYTADHLGCVSKRLGAGNYWRFIAYYGVKWQYSPWEYLSAGEWHDFGRLVLAWN